MDCTVNPNPVQLTAFPCESIPTGKNLLSLQGNPVLIAGFLFSLQGFPCISLYFPVRDCSVYKKHFTIPLRSSHDPPTILQWPSNDPPMILQWSSNDLPIILQWSSNDLPMILQWSYQDLPAILSRFTKDPKLIPKDPLKSHQNTKPERIYNSHYGNGVPAMFTY